MSSIAVVICAYCDERRLQLGDAINSVLKQARKPDRLVVVIDHNDDLLRDMRTSYPDVKVIANDGARGLSGARNTGVRAAAPCDIVAFLDDDAVAEADWLQRLALHYVDPNIIGVGGKVLPLWPDQRPRWFPEEFQWVVGCSYRGQPEKVEPVRNPIGCNMSFRRSILDLTGGFREGIGRTAADAAGCEETELCIRALQAIPGSLILYDPAMSVHHQVTAERAGWRYFRKRCLAEGRSKTQVVNAVGALDGLSSEQRYVMRVLPAGVLRGLTDLRQRLVDQERRRHEACRPCCLYPTKLAVKLLHIRLQSGEIRLGVGGGLDAMIAVEESRNVEIGTDVLDHHVRCVAPAADRDVAVRQGETVRRNLIRTAHHFNARPGRMVEP